MITKLDNHNLQAKLDLRRHFLRQLPTDKPLSVLDCFSGGEVIWTQLRKEFNVGEYLALDVKTKDRRLKLDSLRYLQTQRWSHEVIDLDAYGSPWRHWMEVLKRGLDCMVFLTIGNTMYSIQQTEALASLGITFAIPNGLHSGLSGITADYCISKCLEGFTVKRAVEAMNPGATVRYLGLELRRKELKTDPRSGIIQSSTGTCRESVRPAASEPSTTGQPAATGDAEKE